jgi:predicted PurR-regulated permease PerM
MALSPATKISFWAGFLVLFVLFVWVFNNVLTPFILGIAIAYLLNPVAVKFSRKQIPRWATALIILTLFFGSMALLFILVAPMAFRQAQMLIEQIPNYIQNVLDHLSPYLTWIQDRVGDDYIQQINDYLKGSAGKVVGATGGVIGGIATGGKFLAGMATTLVLTPLVAFFMMKEWPYIVHWVENMYPRHQAQLIRALLKKIDMKVAGFIRGQISVAFILGVMYAIALTVAGLNYGFLIGLGAGLFSIIPLVGSALGLVVGVVVAWFQTGDLIYTGIIAVIFMGGQFIEGNFLAPKIVGDSVGLHPLWIMFALLAGGSFFGMVGMLIAVPMAAVVGVLGGFLIDQYKASPLYLKNPDDPSPTIMPDDNPDIIIEIKTKND